MFGQRAVLGLPGCRNASLVRNVRRSSELVPRVYVISTKNDKEDQIRLRLVAAVISPSSDQVLGSDRTDSVLDWSLMKESDAVKGEAPPCVIVERECKVFVLLGLAETGSVTLKTFHLVYGKKRGVDFVAGYEGPGFKVKGGGLQKSLKGANLLCHFEFLNINKHTGDLVGMCLYGDLNGATGQLRGGAFPIKITLDKKGKSASLVPLICKGELEQDIANLQERNRPLLGFGLPVFSRKGKAVICWYNYDSNEMSSTGTAERVVALVPPVGHVFVNCFPLSVDSSALSRGRRVVEVDALELVSKVVPQTVLQDILQRLGGAISDAWKAAANLAFVGRIYKYLIFSFGPLVLAVKGEGQWYSVENVLKNTKNFQIIPLDPMLCKGGLEDVNIVGDKIVVRIKRQAAGVLDLFVAQPALKYYHSCARCGKVEKRKKRGKDGKRRSRFKVCRKCKERGFHLRCGSTVEVACHYCSRKCQEKHWSVHKIVHKKKICEK